MKIVISMFFTIFCKSLKKLYQRVLEQTLISESQWTTRSKLKCGITILANSVQDYCYPLKNFLTQKENSKSDGEKLVFRQDQVNQDINLPVPSTSTHDLNINGYTLEHCVFFSGKKITAPPPPKSECARTPMTFSYNA